MLHRLVGLDFAFGHMCIFFLGYILIASSSILRQRMILFLRPVHVYYTFSKIDPCPQILVVMFSYAQSERESGGEGGKERARARARAHTRGRE